MGYADKYMDHKHPDAFVDFAPPKAPSDLMLKMGYNKVCPMCKGHGGWNLRLNAYRMPDGYEGNPYNRNRYCHFRASCGHCSGWGYVSPEEPCEGHEWARVAGASYMGMSKYVCIHCEKEACRDSSD